MQIAIYVLIVIIIMYEKILRYKIYKLKIGNHIKKINGSLISVEKLASQNDIYRVYYSLNGNAKYENVLFDLFLKEVWEEA